MAISVASVVAVVCLLMAALATSGMLGMHVLPPSLEAPLMALHNPPSVSPSDEVAHKEDLGDEIYSTVELMQQQLKSVNVLREPEKAYALNSGIAKLLRHYDPEDDRVVHHFEAARDAASRSGDPDTLLSAQLDLAEAYGEQQRPLDAQQELSASQLNKYTGQLPSHFAKYGFKLNRGRGLEKFQLGQTESALSYYQQAAQYTAKPDDLVRIACDRAAAQACLGHARNSLEPLQGALEVLEIDRQPGEVRLDWGEDLPAELQTNLAAEVEFRLAEVFHSMASEADAEMIVNILHAEEHYQKAAKLQHHSPSFKPLRVAAIEHSLAQLTQTLMQDLQSIPAPSLHCPSPPRDEPEESRPRDVPEDKQDPTPPSAPRKFLS